MPSSLSSHDTSVLNTILSGGEPTGPPPYILDPELPPDQYIDTETVAKLVNKEKRAIELAEGGNLAEALLILDGIVKDQPKYASAYNNRAQIHRESGETQRATKDLEEAISLATPRTRFLSKMQATVLKNANAQLGAIELQVSREAENKELMWEYGERASKHLALAGSFGDKIMAALATKVNPYAKLCGGMVEQALRTERE